MPDLKAMLLKKITIQKVYSFAGNATQFESSVMELSKFKWRNGYLYSSFVNENHFVVTATISVGTLMIGGVGGPGIKVHLLAEPANENIRVVARTKLRPENWFLLFVFLFFIGATIVDKQGLYMQAIIVATFIGVLAWFNILYKIQERILLAKVVARLQLKEIK